MWWNTGSQDHHGTETRGNESVNDTVTTGRGYTQRKRTERYGFDTQEVRPGKRQRGVKEGIKRKRHSAESVNNNGRGATQKVGPRKMVIKVGGSMMQKIEGTYEDNNAQT